MTHCGKCGDVIMGKAYVNEVRTRRYTKFGITYGRRYERTFVCAPCGRKLPEGTRDRVITLAVCLCQIVAVIYLARFRMF